MLTSFSLSLWCPLPSSAASKDSSPLIKTTTRHMRALLPSSSDFLLCDAMKKTGRVTDTWFIYVGCEEKRDDCYIQEVIKLRDLEHFLLIFLHIILDCVFCADPTPALSSFVVTRISKPPSSSSLLCLYHQVSC